MGLKGVIPIDLPIGEAFEHFLEGDTSLEAGQRRAQAKVYAIAERDVPLDRAMDVEAVPIGETTLVAVC